jgi:hypothetical protein
MFTLPALLQNWTPFKVSLMRKTLLSSAAMAAALLFAAPALASSGSVTVNSATDIWLAGQPNGSSLLGGFSSTPDTAPGNSPVLLSGALSGATFTFSASGSTSVDGFNFGDPDGAAAYPDESSFGVGPANGVGTYNGPASALIGVFFDDSTPSGTGGLASQDYTLAGAMTATAYSPQLSQIFFIGDGLTGDGTGDVQVFTAPTGATRLFLADADSLGSSTGNLGSLAVNFSSSADITVTAGVPEPAAWGLMIAGFGLAGTALRRRRSAATA